MVNEKDKNDSETKKVLRSATELQRLKLEKLMKNPDKPVLIPDRPKGKLQPAPPDFVRNVMGSSAGAGSGEFHVYRHLRRKEYSRQKFIQEKTEKELLDKEFENKMEENKRLAEEKTAKKRAKRLKKKNKAKMKSKKPKIDNRQSSNEEENSDNENQSDSDEQTDNKDQSDNIDHLVNRDLSENNDTLSNKIDQTDCTSQNESQFAVAEGSNKDSDEIVSEVGNVSKNDGEVKKKLEDT